MKTTNTSGNRPLAERVTQGTVTYTFLTKSYGNTKQESSQIHVVDGEGDIAKVVSFAGYRLTDEDRANTELITEAFNVTCETGRTPRQLAEDAKELLGVLQEIAEENPDNISDREELIRCADIARAAITKFTTK
jgi:hypothetical protein